MPEDPTSQREKEIRTDAFLGGLCCGIFIMLAFYSIIEFFIG